MRRVHGQELAAVAGVEGSLLTWALIQGVSDPVWVDSRQA